MDGKEAVIAMLRSSERGLFTVWETAEYLGKSAHFVEQLIEQKIFTPIMTKCSELDIRGTREVRAIGKAEIIRYIRLMDSFDLKLLEKKHCEFYNSKKECPYLFKRMKNGIFRQWATSKEFFTPSYLNLKYRIPEVKTRVFCEWEFIEHIAVRLNGNTVRYIPMETLDEVVALLTPKYKRGPYSKKKGNLMSYESIKQESLNLKQNQNL